MVDSDEKLPAGFPFWAKPPPQVAVTVQPYEYKACKRLVSAKQSGCVVNISSVLAQRPGKQQASYGGAKAALDQITRVMSMELARDNIRVNGLAPGYFATEMMSRCCGAVSEGKRAWYGGTRQQPACQG